jgi:hypothetical protein
MASAQHPRRRLKLRWLGLVAPLAALVVAVPLAWASHQFTDVPNANPFHNEIGNLAGAGITAGKTCVPPGTPPTFCPDEPVVRQAMAAFLNRGFGRAAYQASSALLVPTDGNSIVVGSITLSIGGAPGGTQFVKVDAAVGTWITSVTGCPCNTGYFIQKVDGNETTFLHMHTNVDVAPNFVGFRGEELGAVSAIFAVPTASSQTFNLRAARPAGSTGNVFAYTDLTAITLPFGSTGSSTLGLEAPGAPAAPSGSPPPSPRTGS